MPEAVETTAEVICANCTREVPAADTCEACGEPTALQGRYRLEEVVGEGSFGTTYRAIELGGGETVAIKEMLVRRAKSAKSVELFEREATVLQRLDHPGIPTYYDEFWREDQRSTAFFLVQEFIDGRLVADTHLGGPNHPDEVFGMLAELLETLGYLHEFSPPVVHRDVKPANLMIRNDDESLVLIDFGSVQAALNPEQGGSTVAGTFSYMAPEQLSGHAGPKSDVYGAAATAVALLSGSKPDFTPADTPDLSRLNITAPHRRLLERMLDEDPDERPAAKRAVGALREIAGEKSSPSPAQNGDSSEPPDWSRADTQPLTPTGDGAPEGNTDVPAQRSHSDVMRHIAGVPRELPPNFYREYPTEGLALEQWRALRLPLFLAFAVAGALLIPFVAWSALVCLVAAAPLVLFVYYACKPDESVLKEVWRRGGLARGVMTADNRVEYQFEVYNKRFNGNTTPASVDTSRLAESWSGAEIPVLYLPEDPRYNLPVSDFIIQDLAEARE